MKHKIEDTFIANSDTSKGKGDGNTMTKIEVTMWDGYDLQVKTRTVLIDLTGLPEIEETTPEQTREAAHRINKALMELEMGDLFDASEPDGEWELVKAFGDTLQGAATWTGDRADCVLIWKEVDPE